MTLTESGTSAVTMPTERTVRIERIFDAPRERVWRALTEAELLAQWWGRGNPLDVERLEVERGGHWRFVEHSDGETHGFEGRFREVTPPERIAWTFEWDGMPGYTSVDELTLEDLGDGRTRIINDMTFFTKEERDGMVGEGMEEGMNDSYAALDKLLANLE